MAGLAYSDQILFSQPLHGVLLTGDRTVEQEKLHGEERLTTLRIWRNRSRSVCTSVPIWIKEERGERYKSQLKLYKRPDGFLLKINCEGRGEFEYTPEGIGIYWEKQGTGPAHYLQAIGLSLWLELRGIPCIHANCLAVRDEAFGIIAPSRRGKTTLTAALLDTGMQMMTDDMLALYQRSGEWIAYPGWSYLRIWPDTASSFMGLTPEQHKKVHARFEKRVIDLARNERFKVCKQYKSLKQLFILDRTSKEVEEVYIQDVSPGEAIIHLLQNSILGDAYQALGVEQARLNRLAEILDCIPLRKLSYPSGYENLPKVCALMHAEL